MMALMKMHYSLRNNEEQQQKRNAHKTIGTRRQLLCEYTTNICAMHTYMKMYSPSSGTFACVHDVCKIEMDLCVMRACTQSKANCLICV